MRADPLPDPPAPGTLMLRLRLGEQEYALASSSVRRILPMLAWTAVPPNPQGVVGLLNLGGVPVPVLDPRPRLGLPGVEQTLEHPLVLMQPPDAYALWVDRVVEVFPLSSPVYPLALPASSAFFHTLQHAGQTLPLLAAGGLTPQGFVGLGGAPTP